MLHVRKIILAFHDFTHVLPYLPYSSMSKTHASLFILACICQFSFAQTTLEADGPGDTYELINSVMAPGYDVVEVPDCNHGTFGRHIEEIFDASLNKHVFRFHIHTTPDNDRCRTFDRQRNEIKAYDKSPDNLLAVRRERVRYTWKFKLDQNFQSSSSFTHLHQLKAVGGSQDAMPLITLTTRKGTPDRLELRYAEALSQRTLTQTDLAPLLGHWLQATETVLFDEVGLGKYEVHITKIDGGDTLFSYVNNAIRTWKTNADFIRPKWGIYRSLNNASSLRDEEVLFADFGVEELDATVSIEAPAFQYEDIHIFPNPVSHSCNLSDYANKNFDAIRIYDSQGRLVLSQAIDSQNIPVSQLGQGVYVVELSARGVVAKPIKVLIR